MPNPKPTPPALRVEARCVPVELGYRDACLIFQGWINNKGYGSVHVGSRTDGSKRRVLAHRAVWEHHHGPIPAGMQIDHSCCDPRWCAGGLTCPHRACVRLDHLQLATNRENTIRGNAPIVNRARMLGATRR